MTEEQSVPGSHDSLWTLRDLAAYLKRSPRWISYHLPRAESEPGSIPHLRLGRSPRFVPSEISAWVRAGCPSVSTFHQKQSPSEARRAGRAL